MIGALLSAAPAIASVVGGLFGKKDSGGETVNTAPQWLLDLQKQLGGWASAGLNNYTPGDPYGGNLNFAGSPTSQEQSGLDQLTKFLGAPGTGSLFDAASNQVSDTLAGKFADPASSPFIKAMTSLSKQNLQDSITDERGRRGARGTYYTDAGVRAEGTLQERTLNNLNAIIGQFQQQERQNQVDAGKTAANLDQYKNVTMPLQKIGASQTYGSLSRLIDQSNLESQYQDFLRQRQEKELPVKVATSLATNQQNITPGQVTSPVTTGTNSLGTLMNLVPNLLGIGKSIFPNAFGA